VIAAVTDVVIASPVSFLIGLLVGWLVSSRWRIVHRPNSASQVFDVPEEMRHKRS
jgi:hypothetical protein